MIYRDYGSTGKKVSLLGFGGMRFEAVDDREACVAMMTAAAESGVNYFDTAPKYFGNKSEAVFGEAFRELRRRGLPFYSATKTFNSTEKEIRTEVDYQLKRLGVDAIDFYHVWCVLDRENWEQRKKNGVIDTFLKLKEEGLVRHICVSSHLVGDGIKDLLMEGVFEGVLFGYSAYNFRTRQAAFEAVAAKELGCAIMNPLGGGVIPRNPGLFGFLKTRDDETAVQAALRFLFAHERISTVLVGFGNLEQVREAVRAVEGYVPFEAGRLEAMKAASARSFEGLCTGCGYCDDCPEGLPIPKYLDAYNQKLLLGQTKDLADRLKWHWGLSPAGAAKCSGCGRCESVCTQHLPIIERLRAIAELAK